MIPFMEILSSEVNGTITTVILSGKMSILMGAVNGATEQDISDVSAKSSGDFGFR